MQRRELRPIAPCPLLLLCCSPLHYWHAGGLSVSRNFKIAAGSAHGKDNKSGEGGNTGNQKLLSIRMRAFLQEGQVWNLELQFYPSRSGVVFEKYP